MCCENKHLFIVKTVITLVINKVYFLWYCSTFDYKKSLNLLVYWMINCC